MGKAITYCVQCSKRVSDSEFETGKAFKVGDRILCRACAPESVKNQTSKKIARPANSSTSAALRVQKAPPAPPQETAAKQPDRKKLLLLAGGAAVALLVVIVLVLVFRKGAPPPAAKLPDHPTPPPTAAPVDAKTSPARADLEKAREYAKAHPEDLRGRMKQFTDLTWKWEGSDVAAEAAKEAEAVKALILDQVKVWMDEAEAQIQDLLAKGDPYAAAKKMESLKPTHDLAQWNLAVEKRASDLYIDARKLRDLEAAKKAEEEEKAARAAAAAPKGADKPLSAEAKGYRARWEAAAARATARDFGAAIAEIDAAAGALKEEDVRNEAAQDLEDLKRVAALRTSALNALKAKTRGAGLSLAVRQPSGEVRRIGGMILQIDAQRVEVQVAKNSAFVEWADVAASTLAGTESGTPADPRTLAQVCLLEGEIEAAKAYPAALAPKWWSYAEGARAKLPPPDLSEKSARELYYQAERGFRSMETRPAAVERYKTLREDYGASSLVKAYAARIARRAGAGKEYYFAPQDFHVEGTIRLAKSGKLESVKDSDIPDTLYNLADLEFAALPGLDYRCWVWVGACCEETFQFYVQGTELVDVDQKTRKKVACEPGTNMASPAKLSIRYLKKTHEDHRPKGVKVHPKTAARWEWVEIPLPKYASPGAKQIRIMTHHAGFSIGGAVVSSTRKTAPAESELQEIEKQREIKDAPPLDPDLIAWWTFEEGGGLQAVDLTGKGHDAKVVGAVQWADGKIGGGLRFTGPGSALRVEDAEELRLPGDLTLALWMKKEGEAGDWSCLLGKGEKQERNYCLWLEGNTRCVMFQQYGAAAVNLKSSAGVPDNTWTHVVATAEGAKATLYLNGVKNGEMPRGGTASTPAFPVGMGWACEHGTYRGVLDDIRIYRRALTADEVRTLYEQGR